MHDAVTVEQTNDSDTPMNLVYESSEIKDYKYSPLVQVSHRKKKS
jgi:hypothetical protein